MIEECTVVGINGKETLGLFPVEITQEPDRWSGNYDQDDNPIWEEDIYEDETLEVMKDKNISRSTMKERNGKWIFGCSYLKNIQDTIKIIGNTYNIK